MTSQNTTLSQTVSVIVPNFNYGRFIEKCITSILDQTYKSIEIIVVDDGSTDNSINIVRPFLDRIILLTQANAGVNSARNRGILQSTGTFVALCDADDFWEPTKIEKQMKVLKDDSRTELVGTSICYFSEEGKEIFRKKMSREGNLSKMYLRNPGVAWVPNAPSSALFRKSSALSVGLFDESLTGNAEDWEFFARLSMCGNFVGIKEALVNVRVHPASRSHIELVDWYADNKKALSVLRAKRDGFKKFDFLIGRIKLGLMFYKTLLKQL